MSKGRRKDRKWQRLQAEIDVLKLKHGKDRSRARAFPDLSGPSPTGRSLSNGFAPVVQTIKPPLSHSDQLIVSHLHKSAYQVLLRSEVPFAAKKP
jgi:hypothetical protein